MKRTLEWILTICGTIMSFLLLIMGVVFLIIENNQSFVDKWGGDTYELLLELMENIRMDWILPGVIGVVFGGVFMYILKTDAKLMAGAWMSIVVSGVLSFMSAFGSFPAFFFIVAGLVILVRKVASMEDDKNSNREKTI